MRIFNTVYSPVQNTKFTPNQSKDKALNKNTKIQNNYSPYSAEHIKANFLPSFDGLKKVGTTAVQDRITGQYVPAEIKKEKIGDYTTFVISVNKRKAGYLEMKANCVVPETDFMLTTETNCFPRITHLRSLMGERYAGIGTALIKTAIQESYNTGNCGNLWLYAERGYARTLSPYRADENPIPFYYKVGFESPIEEKNKEFKKHIDKGAYKKLPDIALLVLNEERRDEWLKILSSTPIIKFKEPKF